jgi:hypothetical protein
MSISPVNWPNKKLSNFVIERSESLSLDDASGFNYSITKLHNYQILV